MKTLTFSPTDKRTFEMLYQGLVWTQKPLDRAEIRVHSKILGKLEAIGRPETIALSKRATFTLSDSGGVIELEDAEYELANRCFDQVPFNAELSREVSAMLAFFEAAAQAVK